MTQHNDPQHFSKACSSQFKIKTIRLTVVIVERLTLDHFAECCYVKCRHAESPCTLFNTLI
jgi:hypothetical protein